jgi:hypothetical protein
MVPNSKIFDTILDVKQADKALNDLEHMIEQLKRDYEIFFAGGIKRPPLDLRTNTERSVRRFASLQTLNNAQRFRFNSLAARFNVYAELWNKQIRLKEEGKLPGAIPPAAASHLKKQPAGSGRSEDPKLKELFKNYIASKSSTGGVSNIVNFENFVQALSKQREQILNQHQCKDVEFYLAEVDGRTKLKARIIK